MHLKSVTLKGFKSFAQPTTFAFETGVTCIVTNGSCHDKNVDCACSVPCSPARSAVIRRDTVNGVLVERKQLTVPPVLKARRGKYVRANELEQAFRWSVS